MQAFGSAVSILRAFDTLHTARDHYEGKCQSHCIYVQPRRHTHIPENNPCGCIVIIPAFSPQGLLSELIVNCDGALKSKVVAMAAEYEHRMQLGSKAIFHLEAFVAKFMSIYKQFLEEGLIDMF